VFPAPLRTARFAFERFRLIVTLGKGRRASGNQARFANVVGAFWRRRFSLHFLEERFEGEFRQFRLRHRYVVSGGVTLHADNTSQLADLAGYGCRRYLSSSDGRECPRILVYSGNILNEGIRSAKFSQCGIGPAGVAAKLLQWWE
jgi:hypothetical protein